MTSDRFLHESIYRGAELIARLGEPLVTVCGAGAIGSHLTDNLTRQGFRRFRVIDCDRVEEHNVNTQLYDVADVGARKVDVLRNRMFRTVEVEIDVVNKKLEERNARSLLKGSDIVVDTFDNSELRQQVQDCCRQMKLDCLHVGLHADYCEVVWDEQYRVPQDVEGDVCEYPLARNLVLLSVALASETLLRYISEAKRTSRSATLGDFTVRELERPK